MEVTPLIAYFFGGMKNAQNEGEDWRINMANWLKGNFCHDTIDPVLESKKLVLAHGVVEYQDWKTTNHGKYKEFIRLFINQDLSEVSGRVDYLIVIWDESILYGGGGTHVEDTMVDWADKPIFLVNKLPKEKLNEWVSSCSTETFKSFEGLKKALLIEFQS